MSVINDTALFMPNTIHSLSYFAMPIVVRLLIGGQPSSGAWPTANKAIFVPFVINTNCTVKKMFVVNGATASGNLDIGIYNEDGTKLVSSGSTAQSGTNGLQVIDVTDTPLSPGAYYMALAMNGITGTMFKYTAGTGAQMSQLGVYQQTTAFPLPATATFATGSSSDRIPMLGLLLDGNI